MLHLARTGALALALSLPAAAVSAGQDLPPGQAAWNTPMAPLRVSDHLYYVGARGVSSFLIDTGDGLILLDGGFEATAPQILANIRKLGFDPRDIDYLLSSQAHMDHVGGLAEIKRVSAARMVASREDGARLERGGLGDPHHGDTLPFPAVKVDRFIGDGEQLRLGRVTLTAHLTPGHTKGCTTWTMPVTDKGRVYTAQFNCGMTAPGYKLLGTPAYPNMADDYEATFAKLKWLPCDIPLAAHGSFFDLDAKSAALAAGASTNPFIDPAGCRRQIEQAEAAFRRQLASERAGTAR
jgi:metallo-beta-lactamase class B